MLDTKLKKTHRLAVLIITICILLPPTILVALYPRMEQVYLQQISTTEKEEEAEAFCFFSPRNAPE